MAARHPFTAGFEARVFQEQKHLNLEISRLQNALVPLRLLFPCTSPEPKIQRRFLKGPCAAFGASTAHSDSNHCGPRLRARRPRVRASEGSLTESLPFPPPSKVSEVGGLGRLPPVPPLALGGGPGQLRRMGAGPARRLQPGSVPRPASAWLSARTVCRPVRAKGGVI